MRFCIYAYFKVSVNECLFYKQDISFLPLPSPPGVDNLFVSVFLDWAVVCILLIVQCHLVTAHMKLGRNSQEETLGRAVCIGCKVRWFKAEKRLLYRGSSKLTDI